MPIDAGKPLQTVITGSLPRPAWLIDAPPTSSVRFRLDGAVLVEAQDDAVCLALQDQEDAGLDIVTDGEMRRRHYIWGFLEGLSGIDTQQLGQKRSRGGRYTESTAVARIFAAVERRRYMVLEAFEYARAHTDLPLKVTLPGPMTTADSLLDEHYGAGDRDLAMRFATLINDEARQLAAAGADIIQIDEPCFNIYVDAVQEWGMQTLERSVAGVGCRTAVHICYGYGTAGVLAWKTQNHDWGHYALTLPLLAKSSLDMVSVECAASGVDIAVLGALAGKDVMLGVIDVGTDAVETAEVVAQRIRDALAYVQPQHLFPSTDCGMVPRSRAAATGKMRSLVRGAALVRDSL